MKLVHHGFAGCLLVPPFLADLAGCFPFGEVLPAVVLRIRLHQTGANPSVQHSAVGAGKNTLLRILVSSCV